MATPWRIDELASTYCRNGPDARSLKAASIRLSTHSGADVVIKEARAHVAADETGKDARDLLRAESRALERTGPRGLAPRLLKLFEQGQHLFLAEELVPGITLREWVPDLIRNAGWCRHVQKPWIRLAVWWN